MGRLKSAPSRLPGLGPRLTGPAIGGRGQPVRSLTNPLKHLYATAEWKRTRWRVLLRDLFTCRMCGRGPQHETSQLVCDHVEPHRGDLALFWDDANLQTLCKSPCHDKHKQALEARTR